MTGLSERIGSHLSNDVNKLNGLTVYIHVYHEI